MTKISFLILLFTRNYIKMIKEMKINLLKKSIKKLCLIKSTSISYIIKNTKENEKNNIKIIKKDNYYRC